MPNVISSQLAAKHTSFELGLRVLCHSCFDGSGGRGWTERSEGSPGGFGLAPSNPGHPSIHCCQSTSSGREATQIKHQSLV